MSRLRGKLDDSKSPWTCGCAEQASGARRRVTQVSLALYRKYRPGRLADVIGQEHVVEPLARALDSDRVHHAYLFSGPRGCGKTSSARILARSLNCEKGPTSEPCGECRSCVDLAPNGPGSLDVIELDAATHGLVDDARDLREKAVYAPVSSKYKIYIIDEAHQLSTGASNALLKMIEEPPPHLRFVFATTEADKIIGTIRSRCHHYSFRLVPTRTLTTHLASICESEGFTADPAALALIARASGGSVRDSLSILGQLLAGSGPEGLTAAEAATQLGYTDSSLIDSIIDSIADRDGAKLFRQIDEVVEGGHDPRRFVADLLDRFRDLIIVSQVPDAAEAGLIEGPDELVGELTEQAKKFGPGELARCADVISRGLSELKGATSPRLQLELLMARVILPSADSGADSLVARVEILERGAATGAVPVGQAQPQRAAGTGSATGSGPTPTASVPPPAPPRLSEIASASAPTTTTQPITAPASSPPVKPAAASPAPAVPIAVAKPPVSNGPPPRLSQVAPTTAPAPTANNKSGPPPRLSQLTSQDSQPDGAPLPPEPPTEDLPPEPTQPAVSTAQPASKPAAEAVTVEQVKAMWPAILDEIKADSRVAWMMVMEATPLSVTDAVVVAGLDAPGTVKRFQQSNHGERIANAMSSVLGAPLTLELTVTGSSANRPPANTAADVSTSATTKAAQTEEDVDGSEDVDDLAGIDLVARELGAVTINEYDEG